MPPKIGGMSKHLTLLLHSDDQLEDDPTHMLGNGLAHEQYLIGKSFPLAAAMLGEHSEENETLFCIEPVHLHATRDHLVLLQLNAFHVSDKEIGQLMQEASLLFSEEGLGSLTQVAPYQWFGKSELFKTLHTHSPAQAQGRNIDWWLPRDTTELGLAKRWRRVQNEVQMRWHIHPINQARDEQGLPTINSIWLSGISRNADVRLALELETAQTIVSDTTWMAPLAKRLGIPLSCEPQLNWETLTQKTFVCHTQAKELWSSISQMLIEHDLELTVIDFPRTERKRHFAAKDFRTRSLAFWRKVKIPSWEELLA